MDFPINAKAEGHPRTLEAVQISEHHEQDFSKCVKDMLGDLVQTVVAPLNRLDVAAGGRFPRERIKVSTQSNPLTM